MLQPGRLYKLRVKTLAAREHNTHDAHGRVEGPKDTRPHVTQSQRPQTLEVPQGGRYDSRLSSAKTRLRQARQGHQGARTVSQDNAASSSHQRQLRQAAQLRKGSRVREGPSRVLIFRFFSCTTRTGPALFSGGTMPAPPAGMPDHI